MDANSINKSSIVSTIYQQQPPAAAANSAETSRKTKAASAPVAVDSVQVSSQTTLRNLDTARAIEQMHANLNQQAKSVRETNEAVNKAVGQINTMRNDLQGITKNYPPYPVDSKARNEILMGYTSLRKELISLMVPAPPPPVYEKVAGMWSNLFNDNGSVKSTALPELTTKSSDAAVKSAENQLNTASSELSSFSDKVTQALVSP